MNWTRGLIRLWLLASIAVTCAIGWDHREQIEYRCYYGYRAAENLYPGRTDLIAQDGADRCRVSSREEISDGATEAFGASFALFLVGAALVWGVRGFRRTSAATSL